MMGNAFSTTLPCPEHNLVGLKVNVCSADCSETCLSHALQGLVRLRGFDRDAKPRFEGNADGGGCGRIEVEFGKVGEGAFHHVHVRQVR